MFRNLAIVLLIGLVAVPITTAQETVAKSKIVSVGVFKNGLATVQQEVDVPGPGSFRLETAPNPIHGTFWIKSSCPVETALRMLDFDAPRPFEGLQDELAGMEVVIHLKNKANQAVLSGKVEATAKRPSGFLVVKTAAGAQFINPSEIEYIEVKGAAAAKEKTVKQQRPEFVLTVGKTEKKPVLSMSYLTHGISWAPSYLVEIADGKSLMIETAATVRNEFANLQDAEIKLMTGFPAIEFANVASPLAPRQNVEKILAASRSDPAGDGPDLQVITVGKRSLKEGETLSLSLGRQKVDFEPVVEWSVASDDIGSITEEIWDVLHFKNPFAFPMSTAPAMIMDKGQFKSQRTCSRAKVGENSSLRFSRAQDMRTRGHENEEPPKKPAVADAPKKPAEPDAKEPKPELIRVGTEEYRRATINGEMTITNQRQQATKIIVRRAVKGRVLETDGNPKLETMDEGLRAINPSYEIVWTVTLAPGESKTVHYRYQSLIPQSRGYWGSSW